MIFKLITFLCLHAVIFKRCARGALDKAENGMIIARLQFYGIEAGQKGYQQFGKTRMKAFYIISGLILYGLTLLCFFIPFKQGQRRTAYIVSGALGFLITLTLIGNLDVLVILIWPIIVMVQIIFISYWALSVFNKKKTGLVIGTILTMGFLLLIMQPWISDWTFSKKDAAKILRFHNIELIDDFKIIKNEAGGLKDYYETFTLKLSDNDFNRISQAIKTSKNYKGLFTDYSNFPSAHRKTTDTIDFETDNHFEREYWTSTKMENGTYHFRFQLDKKNKELTYVGSDE